LTAARLGSSAAATAGGTASNPQSTTNAAKATTADLPSFGIVATNSVTANAATAATSTTAAAAVPISGLPVAIAARALAGSNQFDIRLDPPELGRIDVRLDIDSSGQVTSHVTVDRPETLTLLQSQQPQLERALEQAGLRTADNGLQFSLRDQSFAGQQNNGGNAQPNPTPQLVIPDADLSPVDTTQIYSRWGRGSGLDITV
ncbi:MAG: flagellar hook-length control protein FliK, partial [Xanthobacteraceae bacterium]